MVLTLGNPIRLDLLARAWTSFVDMNYVQLPPEASMFDPDRIERLEEAAHDFLGHLRDNNDDENEIRRAMGWVLNLPPERFYHVIHALRIPYPHHEPTEVRRFLELLWQRAWADWRVKGFDPDEYELEPKDSPASQPPKPSES
ncbi:MAG: hypothetical protein JXB05_03960 [Myxococcaceae bacterium]|nr:hypothetical protein [Myxococcaceae bacterium]